MKQRVTPCFVNGALLLFPLNGLHFTLPCILATVVSASFQSGINHRGESVWEICAVRSVPRISPFLCLYPRTSSFNIEAPNIGTPSWTQHLKRLFRLLMSQLRYTDICSFPGK